MRDLKIFDTIPLKNGYKYKVIMIESDVENIPSSEIGVSIEPDNTVCLSVYNNHNLYRLLNRAIQKRFS